MTKQSTGAKQLLEFRVTLCELGRYELLWNTGKQRLALSAQSNFEREGDTAAWNQLAVNLNAKKLTISASTVEEAAQIFRDEFWEPRRHRMLK